MPILDTCFLYNKQNNYGIRDDIAVMESAFKAINKSLPGWTIGPPKHLDVKQPPVQCDIQIHLEHPIYANIPWGRVNILMVNPDHYVPDAYDAYLHRFDIIICKDDVTFRRFNEITAKTATHVYKIDWVAPSSSSSSSSSNNAAAAATTQSFAAFIGGSSNKAAALQELLPYWHTYPLNIYTSRKDLETTLKAAASSAADPWLISIRCAELDADEHERLLRYYPGHVGVSAGEGFGHVIAKGYAAGAFMILNELPVYKETYGDAGSAGVAWIPCRADDTPRTGSTLLPAHHLIDISCSLSAAFETFRDWSRPANNILDKRSADKTAVFISQWRRIADDILATGVSKGIRHLPPILMPDNCPPISIITLAYNRRNFVELCWYNLLLTDYPRNKIEWIVVEDSDDDMKAGSDKFVKFAADHPEFSLVYVPVGHRLSVGAKRNLGVERATNDICLFMDDDDFYPQTSFRRRVAWLTKAVVTGHQQKAVAITTMAMYDLKRAASAVNVPPWNIPLRQRISEASLCFRKSFWEERKFSEEANIAEGEEWLCGRESDVLEIPPQHIIVALSHGANLSSRRIPAEAPVGCAWGWPEQLLRFLHGLVGVQLE